MLVLKSTAFVVFLQSLFCLLIFFRYVNAATWFVDSAGTEPGDGLTWETPFLTIDEALDSAAENDEIWVKAGSYTLSSQILVEKKVSLLGGFNGTEAVETERDHESNIVIIDGGGTGRCLYIKEDAVVDGFTITNCVSATSFGGGIRVYLSSPVISNCIISNSRALKGGGIYNSTSSPTISNCSIFNNTGENNGGGIYNSPSSLPIIEDSLIYNNTALYGGGIRNYGSSPTIKNSLIYNNTALYGGALYNSFSSSPEIIHSTIYKNEADFGGGVYNTSASSPVITNTILWGNLNIDEEESEDDNVSNTKEVFNNDNDSTPLISYSIVEGNYTGTANIGEDPLFTDPNAFDLSLSEASPAIDAAACNSTVTTDILGGARPQGVECDIGAYEYASGSDQACDPLGIDIKVNGSDTPDAVTVNDSITISLALEAGCDENTEADWWLEEFISGEPYYFDLLSLSWVSSGDESDNTPVTFQGPLFSFPEFDFYVIDEPIEGAYEFYFAVDLTMDGEADESLYSDSVTIDVE